MMYTYTYTKDILVQKSTSTVCCNAAVLYLSEVHLSSFPTERFPLNLIKCINHLAAYTNSTKSSGQD